MITKADGTVLPITIGEAENEPVFFFTDLLPHLSREQMSKSAASFISAEQLKLLVGSQPLADSDSKTPYRDKILSIFHEPEMSAWMRP